MQHILDQNLDMATALLAGEKLKELILPGSSQDEKSGALASLMVQLKLELPFDRVVTIGTVIIPILLVTLVFTRNFAGELSNHRVPKTKQLKSFTVSLKKLKRGQRLNWDSADNTREVTGRRERHKLERCKFSAAADCSSNHLGPSSKTR